MNLRRSTYKADNNSIGLSAEIDRLQAQSRLTWKKEFRNLLWFGLTNGMDLLEVGCGPGFGVQQLAERLPDSKVTALDVDGKLLAHARQLLDRHGQTATRLIQASVYDTGLPDESFDFVIARNAFPSSS
ncbi:class I SAM-dependent methyltransferase [Planococcus lenghuensis]|uniref:Methyltransferase domain-containing protein n=1 Tax=Planococcus lenghuensis TaxID=2213202 RepID=A0A1Q2KY15_9BACL|nr:class I SAM-dependent methyltransferase [Planococcus lenghuensis]AQQ53108.1 hypothetical protein B0X71_08370 [Planococcus lenghuensis]